jgi:20S proteasome subunit beta 4
MKHDEDKLKELDDNKILCANGDAGDRVNFVEFIEVNLITKKKKNLNLYRFSNDRSLSTKATANFVRNELATALRKGPYNCNLLLGGYEKEKGPELYYIDYLSRYL